VKLLQYLTRDLNHRGRPWEPDKPRSPYNRFAP